MPRVLIVDDEPHAVELLSEFLTAKDYEAITPSHGEESATPTGPDWNGEGHRIIPVTPEAIARLATSARRFVIF